MKKETVKMRFWGLVIVPLMIIVFKNLYSLTNGALLGKVISLVRYFD